MSTLNSCSVIIKEVLRLSIVPSGSNAQVESVQGRHDLKKSSECRTLYTRRVQAYDLMRVEN
jgi:hypothetical protein